MPEVNGEGGDAVSRKNEDPDPYRARSEFDESGLEILPVLWASIPGGPPRGHRKVRDVNDRRSGVSKSASRAVKRGAKKSSKKHHGAVEKPAEGNALDALRMRANAGDPAARNEIRKFLDMNPAVRRRLGNLAAHAEMSIARLASEGEFLMQEAITRQAAEMRRDLAGAFPTPLEVLGVERVVQAWLFLQATEAVCSRVEGDLRPAAFWLKRRQAADHAYRNALKCLLLVRELLPAAVEPDLAGMDDEPTRGTSKVKVNGAAGISPTTTANGQAVNRIAAIRGKRRQPQHA
jgi:hypothetical protein